MADIKLFGQTYKLEPTKPQPKSSKVYRIPLVQLPAILVDIPSLFGGDVTIIQNNTALEILKQVQAQGYLKEPHLLVGGRPAASVFSANLGQRIQWIEGGGGEEGDTGASESAFFNSMLAEAHRIAMNASPKDTGLFMRNFVWLDSNQNLMGSGPPQQTNWDTGSVVYLVNRAPYGRKIEELKKTPPRLVGSKSRVKADTKRGFSRYSMRAPNGVFRVVSKRIRSKFKQYIQARMALVRKQYIKLPSTLYGISTTLKDGRYPVVRFVYRGSYGYKKAQRNLAVAEAKKIINVMGG